MGIRRGIAILGVVAGITLTVIGQRNALLFSAGIALILVSVAALRHQTKRVPAHAAGSRHVPKSFYAIGIGIAVVYVGFRAALPLANRFPQYGEFLVWGFAAVGMAVLGWLIRFFYLCSLDQP